MKYESLFTSLESFRKSIKILVYNSTMTERISSLRSECRVLFSAMLNISSFRQSLKLPRLLNKKMTFRQIFEIISKLDSKHIAEKFSSLNNK